ncbi:MAG: septum site-determining protein MinC [Cyanobacteria bacterium QS_8_64_29]|nr:MAG: septum site-determining protein MinC [Cyanobacteria bacterium QS_8_64_29]
MSADWDPQAITAAAPQVALAREGNGVRLSLPQAASTQDWPQLWQQLTHRLNGSECFWSPQAQAVLSARDRLLDARQLQAIAEALAAVDLQLERVATSRRQTAVAAAAEGYSVEQQAPSAVSDSEQVATPQAEPLYLQTTVRSGVEVRHQGTVVILGDLNPSGSVTASGDIVIWGRLRGIAHAGVDGNRNSRILALQMAPTQLRIADVVARAPETEPTHPSAEVAYVAADGIRLVPALAFNKGNSDGAG